MPPPWLLLLESTVGKSTTPLSSLDSKPFGLRLFNFPKLGAPNHRSEPSPYSSLLLRLLPPPFTSCPIPTMSSSKNPAAPTNSPADETHHRNQLLCRRPGEETPIDLRPTKVPPVSMKPGSPSALQVGFLDWGCLKPARFIWEQITQAVSIPVIGDGDNEWICEKP